MADWRISKCVFSSWKRLTRRNKEIKIIETEKIKARNVNRLRHRAIQQRSTLTLCKIFQAWRMFTKLEREKTELARREQETQLKMEKLISKIKNKVILQDCETDEIQPEFSEPVPVKPVTPRNYQKPIKAWTQPKIDKKSEMIEIQHKHQLQLIDEQTKKLKIQNDTIKALRAEKAKSTEKVVEASVPPVSGQHDKNEDTTQINIKSIVRPHASVLNMQKRQTERERRKQEILKAKLYKKELEEKKILEEKNRRTLSEKAERLRIKSEKEKQKQAELEKKKRLEQTKILNAQNFKIAKNHHVLSLKKKSLAGFRNHSENMSSARKMAIEKLELNIIRPFFTNWRQKVKDNAEILRKEADFFRYKQLIKKYFKQWSCVLSLRDLQENLARNHSEKRRKNLVFHSWSQLVVDEKVEIWRKEKEALTFRNSVILRKSFSKWKQLKKINEEEKERENRRSRLRSLVKEVLPDY